MMEIQLFLSKLVSNANYALKAFENPRRFIKSQMLSDTISVQFIQFMEEYGSQFVASSLILRRKRYLDVITALDLLSHLYSEIQLEKFWNRYMSNFELNDAVPKNPLMESVVFCQYLLKNEKISETEYELISYECIQNQTTIEYGLHEQGYSHLKLSPNDVNFFDSEEIFLLFHPCMKIHIFKCNISELIKAVKKDQSLDQITEQFKNCEENIVFYKNWHKGVMTSVKISETLKNIIGYIKYSNNSKQAYNNIKNNLNIDADECKKILQTLIQLGMILLISNTHNEVQIV